jgi:hypothetical protein
MAPAIPVAPGRLRSTFRETGCNIRRHSFLCSNLLAVVGLEADSRYSTLQRRMQGHRGCHPKVILSVRCEVPDIRKKVSENALLDRRSAQFIGKERIAVLINMIERSAWK